jgi:hypothetical protein
LVKPGEKKHIRDIEIVSSESKFEMVITSGTFKVGLTFDLKDAEALRRELDEWIDVGTVVRATRRQVARRPRAKDSRPQLGR